MSQPTTDRSVFVPPPIDGLNLVAHPTAFLPTEARQLDNYLVYDWGIRERPAISYVSSSFVLGAYPLNSTAIASGLIMCIEDDTYTYDGSSFSANLQSGFTWTSAFSFNGYVFMPAKKVGGGTDEVLRYRLSNDSWSGSSISNTFTIDLNLGWAYRDRCYFVDDGTGDIYYGGVGAISGAMAGPFAVGQFFQRGRYLIWGTAWNYNQGDINEELFVCGNDAGEVFIYGGDYPAAANWRLIARLDIPAPAVRGAGGYSLSYLNSIGKMPGGFVTVGQDIWLTTARGVVSLQQLFAGRQDYEPAYSISRKLGPLVLNATPTKSTGSPFAYFSDQADIYVINYERGAWSKIPTFTAQGPVRLMVATRPSTTSPQSSTVYFFVSTVAGGGGPAGGGFYKLTEGSAATADSAATYTWKTPHFDFGGKNLQKRSNMIRVLGRNVGNAAVFKNTVSISTDFIDPASPVQDSKTTTAAADTDMIQELAPPGVGRRLSYVFSKTGGSVSNEQNEILGFEAHFSEGGVY